MMDRLWKTTPKEGEIFEIYVASRFSLLGNCRICVPSGCWSTMLLFCGHFLFQSISSTKPPGHCRLGRGCMKLTKLKEPETPAIIYDSLRLIAACNLASLDQRPAANVFCCLRDSIACGFVVCGLSFAPLSPLFEFEFHGARGDRPVSTVPF